MPEALAHRLLTPFVAIGDLFEGGGPFVVWIFLTCLLLWTLVAERFRALLSFAIEGRSGLLGLPFRRLQVGQQRAALVFPPASIGLVGFHALLALPLQAGPQISDLRFGCVQLRRERGSFGVPPMLVVLPRRR